MKTTFRMTIAALLAAVTVALGAVPARACGPFTISARFALKSHADFPLEEYLEGRTGIVPRTFGRLSLFPFYRELTGAGLSAEERKLVKTALENEIFYRDGFDDPRAGGDRDDPVAKWLAARAAVAADKREIEIERRVASGWGYYPNCLGDSFRTATNTLAERIAVHGKDRFVAEWLKGQDDVFSNCGEGDRMPAAAPDDAPEWLKRDRDYQIAAALLYRGVIEDARDRFEAIGDDAASPWRSTARFVVARTFIRQAGFVTVPDDEPGRTSALNTSAEYLRRALGKLESILKDPAMREFHPSATRLTALVKYRLTPAERRAELSSTLSSGTPNPNLYNDLTDLVWLTDHIAARAEERGSKLDAEAAEKAGQEYWYDYDLKLRDIPAAERTDDLTDWLFTYQAVDGFDHAFERWKESGKIHWFVAAISKADASRAEQLLAEAARVPRASAAFHTIRFHEARLLIGLGRRTDAKARLDEILGSGFERLPRSSQNRFLEQRTALAADLGEFLKFAQRQAAIFDWDENGREEGADLTNESVLAAWKDRPMFDDDAVAFLNEKVPLSTLRKAALNPKLPPHLRKMLLSAAWVRAYALGDRAVLREMAPLLAKAAPDLARYVGKYASARPADQEAAALLAILRYPVLQPYVAPGFGRETSETTSIDSIRGNWWCVERQQSGKVTAYNRYDFEYPEAYPAFLTANERSQAEAEQRVLAEFGDSASGLTRRAVEFATRTPGHPLVPEILHFAVRSTRYGCTDDDTGKLSKEAFDILHKRFPRSTWTKQTPYWFRSIK
jgi:hypothetical protein